MIRGSATPRPPGSRGKPDPSASGPDGPLGIVSLERLGAEDRFDEDHFELVSSSPVRCPSRSGSRCLPYRGDRGADLPGDRPAQRGTFPAGSTRPPGRSTASGCSCWTSTTSRKSRVEGTRGGDRAAATDRRTITEASRDTDRVFRYGGDEFAVIVPTADPAGAMAVASGSGTRSASWRRSRRDRRPDARQRLDRGRHVSCRRDHECGDPAGGGPRLLRGQATRSRPDRDRSRGPGARRGLHALPADAAGPDRAAGRLSPNHARAGAGSNGRAPAWGASGRATRSAGTGPRRAPAYDLGVPGRRRCVLARAVAALLAAGIVVAGCAAPVGSAPVAAFGAATASPGRPNPRCRRRRLRRRPTGRFADSRPIAHVCLVRRPARRLADRAGRPLRHDPHEPRLLEPRPLSDPRPRRCRLCAEPHRGGMDPHLPAGRGRRPGEPAARRRIVQTARQPGAVPGPPGRRQRDPGGQRAARQRLGRADVRLRRGTRRRSAVAAGADAFLQWLVARGVVATVFVAPAAADPSTLMETPSSPAWRLHHLP